MATLSVIDSLLGAKNIPLEDFDPYYMETLHTMLEESYAHQEDFYISVVLEHDHYFYFSDSFFIDWFFKWKNSLKNPLTNTGIKQFEILISPVNSYRAYHYAMKDEIAKDAFFCPILASDPYRTRQERSKYSKILARIMMEKKREFAALYYYEKTDDLNEPEFLLKIADSFMNGKNGMPRDAKQVVRYTQKAACLGNLYAIARMSYIWQEGFGVPKNSNKSWGWRKVLPEWIQMGKMETIIDLIQRRKPTYEAPWNRYTSRLKISETLLVSIAPPVHSVGDKLVIKWTH